MEKETKKRGEEEEMNSRYEKQAQPEEVTEKLFENVRSGLVPQMEGFSPAIRGGLPWKFPLVQIFACCSSSPPLSSQALLSLIRLTLVASLAC